MHMRANRGDKVTGRWAGLAGAVGGLVGVGASGLVAWLLAPLSSPVIAVGELIIEVLPAPLVNFGKETLGYADKPILLIMVVAAVLGGCGLAGRLELRRRFGGAAVFALIAVLGLVGVSAQPGAAITAYLPTIIGLLFGYLILHTLITKLRQWRPRRAADHTESQSEARRTFLGWTLALGALGAAAAVGGQLLAGAATAVNNAREQLRLPTPTRPARPVPAGAELTLAGWEYYPAALGTAVRALLDDPASAARLAERGRAVAATWPTEQEGVAHVLAVYREVRR